MNTFTVIGLGRFGSQLAVNLANRGSEVLAIDSDESLINQYADRVTRAVVADATNRELLRRLGVQNTECAIVAMASDLASSVLITMNLKALGVPKVICKAHDDTHREILVKLGADQVILPERVVADRLSASLSSSDILDYLSLSDDHGIVEFKVPPQWAGKTIREANIRAKYGVTIIAVRQGERFKVSPTADYTLNENAVMILLGDYESLEKMQALHK